MKKRKATIGNEQRFWIPGPMPGLNEIIEANRQFYTRKNKRYYKYASMKKKWEKIIGDCLIIYKVKPVPDKYSLVITPVEPNRRRDPGNVECGIVKILEDALQKHGIIKSDGQKHRQGCKFLPIKINAKRPGVEVAIWPG